LIRCSGTRYTPDLAAQQQKWAPTETFRNFRATVTHIKKMQQTCHGCKHFYITYDPNFPYGCRILGFKSRRLPHVEVEAASYLPCQAKETTSAPDAKNRDKGG
jgi:hypothetical protein